MNFYRNNLAVGSIPQLDVEVPTFFPSELLDGLVAYYKAENSLVDASGNGKDLSASGIGYATGKKSMGFNIGTSGTTNKLYRDDALSLGTGSFTVNMWIKYASTPASGTQMCPISIRVNGTKTQHEFDYRNESGTLKYNIWTGSTGGTESKYNVTETAGTWYMLTFMYNSSNGTLYLYRNTTQILSISTGSTTTSASTVIKFGNQASDNRQVFGIVDEISVHNKILTSGNLSALYASGEGVTY